MDFFSKLGDTITNKSKDVAKKAKEIAEVASLNAQISTKEDAVKNTFVEIGKYVYENNREDAPADMAEKFATIDAINAEIAKLKEDIKVIKGVKTCEQCGGEVTKEAAFCPACGNKMPEEVVEEVEAEASEVAEEATEEKAE